MLGGGYRLLDEGARGAEFTLFLAGSSVASLLAAFLETRHTPLGFI